MKHLFLIFAFVFVIFASGCDEVENEHVPGLIPYLPSAEDPVPGEDVAVELESQNSEPEQNESEELSGEYSVSIEVLGKSIVELEWDDVNNEERYEVYYRKSSAPYFAFDRKAVLAANATTYKAKGLQKSTEYTFFVVAFNGSDSLMSDFIEAKTYNYDLIGPVIILED
jgi:hypothetical protein